MQIRRAEVGDIEGIFSVRTRVVENHMTHAELAEIGVTATALPAMLDGPGCGWVALDGASVVAFAMANAQQASIFALFVLPAYENRGLGRRLLHAAEQWLRAQGCLHLWLETDANDHVRAHGFYRHLGWRACEQTAAGERVFRKDLPFERSGPGG